MLTVSSSASPLMVIVLKLRLVGEKSPIAKTVSFPAPVLMTISSMSVSSAIIAPLVVPLRVMTISVAVAIPVIPALTAAARV
ncbi:hypothetical protein D3C72_816880 [compost metagenome]